MLKKYMIFSGLLLSSGTYNIKALEAYPGLDNINNVPVMLRSQEGYNPRSDSIYPVSGPLYFSPSPVNDVPTPVPPYKSGEGLPTGPNHTYPLYRPVLGRTYSATSSSKLPTHYTPARYRIIDCLKGSIEILDTMFIHTPNVKNAVKNLSEVFYAMKTEPLALKNPSKGSVPVPRKKSNYPARYQIIEYLEEAIEILDSMFNHTSAVKKAVNDLNEVLYTMKTKPLALV